MKNRHRRRKEVRETDEVDITRPPVETAVEGAVVHGGGDLFALQYAAAVMLHLGDYLLPGGKKFRVTIECDPEIGKFTFSRETIP